MKKIKSETRPDLAAEFSAEFGEPPWIIVRGIKLLRSKTGGLWVSMPGHKHMEMGKQVWENHVQIIKEEIFNELNRMAQDVYQNLPN